MASKLDRWKKISANNTTSIENPNKGEIIDRIGTLPPDDAHDVRLKTEPESGIESGNTPTIPESSSENENNNITPKDGIQNRNILEEDEEGIDSDNSNQDPNNDSTSDNKKSESTQNLETRNTNKEYKNDSDSRNTKNTPNNGVNKKNKNKESSPRIDSKNTNNIPSEGVRTENQNRLEEDEGDSEYRLHQSGDDGMGLAHRVSGNVLNYVQNKVTKEMTHKKTSFMASLPNLAKLELFDNAHGGRVKGEFLNSLLEEAFAELENDPQWKRILNKDIDRVIARIRKKK
ncbi:hypothetical protein ACK8P5_25845 (plasmid) [Paenibacillus sp. EC2-1]|uniref:hypothetical protein n=1 Tax=Paenibacillus sp. EC2-1 TaxID=3388665 RepID=UPI003BEF2BD4